MAQFEGTGYNYDPEWAGNVITCDPSSGDCGVTFVNYICGTSNGLNVNTIPNVFGFGTSASCVDTGGCATLDAQTQ